MRFWMLLLFSKLLCNNLTRLLATTPYSAAQPSGKRVRPFRRYCRMELVVSCSNKCTRVQSFQRQSFLWSQYLNSDECRCPNSTTFSCAGFSRNLLLNWKRVKSPTVYPHILHVGRQSSLWVPSSIRDRFSSYCSTLCRPFWCRPRKQYHKWHKPFQLRSKAQMYFFIVSKGAHN